MTYLSIETSSAYSTASISYFCIKTHFHFNSLAVIAEGAVKYFRDFWRRRLGYRLSRLFFSHYKLLNYYSAKLNNFIAQNLNEY